MCEAVYVGPSGVNNGSRHREDKRAWAAKSAGISKLKEERKSSLKC
jgi:hypothetical protein